MLASLFGPPTWWALGAAVPAVAMEYLYRRLPGDWWSYLWVWAPMSLAISYCICHLIRQPNTSIVDALIVWTLSVMSMRIVLTIFVLRDPVGPGTWFALALMLLARFVQVGWK
jgi:hypothetical protein